MPFIVDLLPPSADIEAASALGLAMAERKSKGLFGRKQYEPIEVIARFALPLKTVTWTPGETTGRCLVFDPQALVSGSIRFDLAATIPEAELDPETGEEAFLDLCQQWTKNVTEFTSSALEFAGLITTPDQVAPLLDGEEEQLLAGLEQKADSDGALAQLTEQLNLYTQAAEAWNALKQKAYAHRDVLADKISTYAEEERNAGNKSLEDLSSQVETTIASKRSETDAALAAAQDDYQKRKDMLQAELDRFQEGFKENGDNYWRDQIKTAEKSMAENEKWIAKRRHELEEVFKEFEKQQNVKIRDFKAELEKRMATFDVRLKRLDIALDGFNKGLEKRMAVYEQQPARVLAATVEISTERCSRAHNAVFHAARYPGGRWLVFPPQQMGSRGIIGAVSGLFGGLNLPFKPASKLAETLADRLQRLLPGSELEARLVEANLMEDEQFIPMAKAGLGKLVDQGKLDKKHANLFADLGQKPQEESPGQEPEAPVAPEVAVQAEAQEGETEPVADSTDVDSPPVAAEDNGSQEDVVSEESDQSPEETDPEQ